MNWHREMASILGVALAFGCSNSHNAGSSGGADAGSPGGTDAGEGPATGAVTVGAAGGTVSAGGAVLSIPPGALAADTAITMSVSADPVPAGYAAYSPLYRFEPSGLAFAKAASISIPFAIQPGSDSGNPGNDPRLAALFWSRRGGSGYERVAARISGGTVTAEVTHFSTGFVGNGVEYVDPADSHCARTVAVEKRAAGGQAAGLALIVRAEDCQGRPLTDLSCANASTCDFGLEEDDAALNGVAPKALGAAGHQGFATLVLDVSDSVGSDLGPVAEGAKAFVTRLQVDLKLPVHIGLWTFSGEGAVAVQDPTLDSQLLLRRLDDLAKARPKSNDKVDLNAAVALALQRQAQLQTELENRNAGGAFTTGYVVVFTADADGAGSKTLEDIQARKAARPATVAALALEGGRQDAAALAAFADWTLASPGGASLYRDFSDLANRVAASSSAVYALAYCSPQRSGKHAVAVKVRGASSGGAARFEFSADGFAGGCAEDQLAALCASGQQCGGTLCGACDDRTDICDLTSGTCKSQCSLPAMKNVCAGNTAQNPLGYAQACADRREATRCGGSCADLDTNLQNCGRCGAVCQTTCEGGVCACDLNEKWCGGHCQPILTSQLHCGECDNACADDQKCLVGLCKGNPEWVNGPVPPDVPSQYDVTAETVFDKVTELTWQRVLSQKVNRREAVDYCATLQLAGPAHWRVPTRIELLSIVDIGRFNPAINSESFGDTPSERFWTSTPTPLAGTCESYYYVDFASGAADLFLPGVTDPMMRVRCVR